MPETHYSNGGTLDKMNGVEGAAEQIESIGFGIAQVRLVFLSNGGVFFCDGVEVLLGNIATMAVSVEFGLGPKQRALLVMFTTTGLAIGTIVSGSFGDTIGRVRPTVWCYAGMFVLGFFCACAPNHPSLLVGRFILGFCMGFGMPPSSAMLSENTPENNRVFVKAVATGAFPFGGCVISMIAACIDPTLKALSWRYLMFVAAIPPCILWCLSVMFLPESPIFLASIGKHSEAAHVLEGMRRLNKAPSGPPDSKKYFTVKQGERLHRLDDSKAKRGNVYGLITAIRAQLGIVFSKYFLHSTVAGICAALCINLVVYGDGYAAPQVLAEASSLMPGWQIALKLGISVIWAVLAGLLGQVLARKWAIMLAMAVALTVCVAFVVGASHPIPRPFLFAVLFQYGTNFIGCAASLGFVSIYQFAVEIYPTNASSTGAAVIMGSGRIAAICAPMLFEKMTSLTGTWTSFYLFMSLTAAGVLLVVGGMPEMKPYGRGMPSKRNYEVEAEILGQPATGNETTDAELSGTDHLVEFTTNCQPDDPADSNCHE